MRNADYSVSRRRLSHRRSRNRLCYMVHSGHEQGICKAQARRRQLEDIPCNVECRNPFLRPRRLDVGLPISYRAHMLQGLVTT